MPEKPLQRRLVAILAADVAGYTRLMQADEAGTLANLKSRRTTVLMPILSRHNGRLFKLMGDGALVEFASAVNAVACAVELQDAMAQANTDVPEDRHIILRIGINLGDVMTDGGDLYGDGVNVASRIQALAQPGTVVVSESVFTQVRSKVPFSFEDSGNHQLKNVAEPVRVYRVADHVAASPEPKGHQTAKPAIAVLPFVNMSGDPGQDHFVDGLTEDIITALSRISMLWVISRSTTFTYKGKQVGVKQVAKDLGVQYVMEGSARRSGDRLRITAQLIDARTGHHIWAEQYDRPATDLFDVQDDITRAVAASTETQVMLAEARVGANDRSTDFRFRSLIARAWAKMYEQNLESFTEAEKFVEEAASIDPTNPEVYRMRVLARIESMFYESPSDAAIAECLEMAEQALKLAPGDEYAHWAMARALSEAGQTDDAIAECQINPNCTLLLSELGAYLGRIGQTDQAIETCNLAIRLNPRDQTNFWNHFNIAKAHFIAGNYEPAFERSRSIARSRPHAQSAIIWAASAAALGKTDEARMAVENCLSRRPTLRVGTVVPGVIARFKRDSDHERLLHLLRQAGLPE